MAKRTCSVVENGELCGKPIWARGWCDKHYQRWRKYGDPLVVQRLQGDGLLRFESRVDRSGGPDACHPWTGKPRRDGYGMMKFGGKYRLAHTVAWELANGPVPPGLEIDHECHNRALLAGTCRRGLCEHRLCCNERHLAAKTHLENMLAVGPQERPDLRGRRPASTKLTESQVAEIRVLLSEGIAHGKIAERYGVSRSTVSTINSGKTWVLRAA
jgi:HNH endonuclease/Helix-turn-helix domain of resolvase